MTNEAMNEAKTHRTTNENDEGMVADIRWETDADCSPSDVDCRQSEECGDLNAACVQPDSIYDAMGVNQRRTLPLNNFSEQGSMVHSV